jgi:hypothetical protein
MFTIFEDVKRRHGAVFLMILRIKLRLYHTCIHDWLDVIIEVEEDILRVSIPYAKKYY